MADFVIGVFDALTPDLESICTDSAEHTHGSWINRQTLVASSAGAAAMAMPGAHMLALTADMGVLMNRMAVTSYGIGAIHVRSTAVPVEREDFALVLAMWTGDVSNRSLAEAWEGATAKLGLKLGMKAGGKAGSLLIAHAVGNAAGVLAGKKLGPKVAAKIGAKIGAKLAAKGAAGWLPFVGPAIGAGLNAYFVRDIAVAARQYYQCKIEGISSALNDETPD